MPCHARVVTKGRLGGSLTAAANAAPLLGVVLVPFAGRELSIQLELSCEGRDGAGQPMSMDVVLTAVEP